MRYCEGCGTSTGDGEYTVFLNRYWCRNCIGEAMSGRQAFEDWLDAKEKSVLKTVQTVQTTKVVQNETKPDQKPNDERAS